MSDVKYQITGAEEAACSACIKRTRSLYAHPLFNIPLCYDCNWAYHEGDFTVEDGNEIYCRWCGHGEGELLLCDTCPKGFCSRCIENNFSSAELQRIKNLSNRWCCFICSPQPFRDLCTKKGWKGTSTTQISSRFQADVCYDISRGREKFDIPAINDVDSELPPLNFIYVTLPVAGEGAKLSNNPNFVTCCNCKDNCSNPATCQCIINSGGVSYDATGRLMLEKPSGIYECNYRCACNVKFCRNRVVSSGPSLRLEVFRCSEKQKGWGVRCRTSIPSGTFIADYCGEILPESESELRGMSHCDEYLYSIDCWGRSKACLHISQLGLKKALSSKPRQYFVDATGMDASHLREYLDDDMVEMLQKHGAIDRMLEEGKMFRKKEQNMKTHSENCRASLKMKAHSSDNSSDSSNNMKVEQKNKKRKLLLTASEVNGNQGKKGSTTAVAEERLPLSWYDLRLRYRQMEWTAAMTVLTDRAVVETDNSNDSYVIDARWYGSIGRFLNHSCNPNLDIVMVFCGSHDARLPRIAFFANDTIPAGTELCYDYGYLPGNVDGKHRKCLCGSFNCRKDLY